MKPNKSGFLEKRQKHLCPLSFAWEISGSSALHLRLPKTGTLQRVAAFKIWRGSYWRLIIYHTSRGETRDFSAFRQNVRNFSLLVQKYLSAWRAASRRSSIFHMKSITGNHTV